MPMLSLRSKEAVEAQLKIMKFGDKVEWFKVYLLHEHS